MRPIGFSTGALALGDFRTALDMMAGLALTVVELSALRLHELSALVEYSRTATLPQFTYVSVHAPGRFDTSEELNVVTQLCAFVERGWPVVLHPDAIIDPSPWRRLGSMLLIENMDKRKRIGRTESELSSIFASLPEARLCFDIAHARQFDSSLTEAYKILRRFGSRLHQVHVSEVGTGSKHDRLTPSAVVAYRQLAAMIVESVPIILESPVTTAQMPEELHRAQVALTVAERPTLISHRSW